MFFLRHTHKLKRFIVSGVTAAILLGATLIPASVLASPYGSGSYSDCKYGTGCAASSATTPTTTGSTTKSLTILLNDYNEYLTDAGIQLELSVGQVIYFNVTSSDGTTQKYSITIKEVGADFVVFNISGIDGDIKLMVGETRQFDVDGDGSPDIEITLDGIKDGKAVMTFKALFNGISTTASNSNNPATTQDQTKGSSWQMWLWLALIILGLAIFIILLVKRRKKHKEETRQF